MYTPDHFSLDDSRALRAVITENPFAAMITPGPESLEISHLPLLFVMQDVGLGCLQGHLARANPHWRSFASGGPTSVVFQGPHAYVSPSWYRSTPAVPTWNYVAVHAHGRPTPVEDRKRVQAMLEAQVDHFEAALTDPWRLGNAEDFVKRMIDGIVAFEMPIERLEGKIKLSQNRSAEDRFGVIAALRAGGDNALAEAMETMTED
ncbi:MAG: FMN-binding negative transcriptional regulator [Alphaproteobacteria bacterium]|jgi:transcriptional regulator|nr:transcriptional regulator [Rhodospirillaceae bacterium]MDP6406994.1 FMN-binding negative transcriptional regulator [Alphaproteobacteria bacterium]MDP6624700.1 FMN-binding negative transcriptional regulator [Alphaproteobacteria bacterium]|tara:strand:- start:334 stop:948 length:615 start_codon:yes stop_codon:yes gene_type:complete